MGLHFLGEMGDEITSLILMAVIGTIALSALSLWIVSRGVRSSLAKVREEESRVLAMRKAMDLLKDSYEKQQRAFLERMSTPFFIGTQENSKFMHHFTTSQIALRKAYEAATRTIGRQAPANPKSSAHGKVE